MQFSRIAFFLLVISSLASFRLFAQQITISGYVRTDDGENLIGANIFEAKKHQGTITNAYGFYSFTLLRDSTYLTYSYVGYQPITLRLASRKDTVIIVKLKSQPPLKELIITSEKADKIQESTRMGTISLPISQIKAMPSLMGEVDLIKVLQLLPGVQGGSEGSSGLYVRGGGPEQNLILLDGVPVYNASHLYGFISTFNPDAINHVELVKGGFPARYGGRLSSVVDISMKEGNPSKLHGTGSVGIISSKFALEGPIVKDRASFIISARRSYLNLLNSPIFGRSNANANNYYFYDFNAKVNFRVNKRNRIYLSYYSGSDKATTPQNYSSIDSTSRYSSKSIAQITWGNIIASTRWNHVFNQKLFANISVFYSQYHLQVINDVSTAFTNLVSGVVDNEFYNYAYQSGLRDFASKIDFDFVPAPDHYLRFGAQAINHYFTPGVTAIKSSLEIPPTNTRSSNISANELSAYAEDDFNFSSNLKVNAGIHGSGFLLSGKNYFSLQPRIAARLLLSPDLSLKASFATMQQYIHLLTNSGLGLPTDLWVPATERIRPETSKQVSLGLARNFKDEFEVSLEGYYKTISNVIEYKDGATYLNADKNWESKVDAGRGKSYGAELFVQKKFGKLSGWVGYTLSWTYRQFDSLNNGKWFPYRYDRRHDAKIALVYTKNERLQYGLIWVYGTGNAITVPLDMYQGVIQTGPTPFVTAYEGRNNFRMNPYHRLDLNASYVIRKKSVEHKLTVSVYNCYNRKNPYYLEFGYGNNGQRVLRQVSLFPALPSITYTIKF